MNIQRFISDCQKNPSVASFYSIQEGESGKGIFVLTGDHIIAPELTPEAIRSFYLQNRSLLLNNECYLYVQKLDDWKIGLAIKADDENSANDISFLHYNSTIVHA